MSLFAIADLHLSLGVNKPMDVFPGWENYVERLTENWKALVKPEDTVVIAGDISWGLIMEESRKDFEYLDTLPGTKIILKGNHDYWFSTKTKVEKELEAWGIKTVKILFNNAFEYGDFAICGTRGWMNDQTDDYAAIQAEVQLFERVVERILQKMPEGLSNYGKCCYFAFVITVRNEYDHAQETLALPYQPYNTLVWGTGVCQGYARTFALLCEKAGILCRYCTGLPPLDDGDSHAWNRVDSDAGYIYVDVTWYDRDIPMTTYRDGGLDYLFMTQEEFDFLGYTQAFVEEP